MEQGNLTYAGYVALCVEGACRDRNEGDFGIISTLFFVYGIE